MFFAVVAVLLAVAAAAPRGQFNPVPFKPQFQPQPFVNPHTSFQKPAQQDCVYSQWTQWEECNAACEATAFQQRTRSILKEASGYGRQCSQLELEEWRECRGAPCAQDCSYGDWAAWSACPSCGEGVSRHRNRNIVVQGKNGGVQCDFGSLAQSEQCLIPSCDVDCEMSSWTAWTACSANCGEGRRSRTRNILVQPKFNGLQCGPAEEWENCNSGPCPQNCAYSDWAAWSACPTCGDNEFRSRSRQINQQGLFGGVTCDFGSLSQSDNCLIPACPVHCEMEQWSAWSACSADCGAGRRARTRSVLVQPQNGGLQCGPAEEWEACQSQPCAVDCEMGQWAAWSQCSAPCDGGQRSRNRFITVQAQFGGLQCGPVEDWEQCNQQECARDCDYSNWASWSQCPSCGQADRSRSRQITVFPNSVGAQCDFGSLLEAESCNNRPCKVDCEMSSWTAWTACSANCGNGQRSRNRFVNIQPAFGGLACGPVEDWEACNDKPCPVHCEYSNWASWSQCPSCGQGVISSRSRQILVQGQFGGRVCNSGDLSQSQACRLEPCFTPCEYGQWAAWSQCPQCGDNASRNRNRQITKQAVGNGPQCDFGSLFESEQCSILPCAEPCQMEAWAAWSQCSSSCGKGKQSRTRGVLSPAKNGGAKCGAREEWTVCFAGPCEKHCEVSAWTAWSGCSAECGGGSQSRTRSILAHPSNGGRQCPSLEDWKQCNLQQCAPPSICANVFGTKFLALGPCETNFILCSNGIEHQKTCPGGPQFKFDEATDSCKHISKIAVCNFANPPVVNNRYSRFN